MKEVRFFYVPDAASMTALPDEEAVHATRVLRLGEGQEIFLMDGCGCFYRAEITLATQKKCLYRIVETLRQDAAWNGEIQLAIAPTKMMERMEWLAEKATEVGFNQLTFLKTQFSERKDVKVARIDKIVVSATKQSRKPWKPVVDAIVDFKEFVEKNQDAPYKYIAHCYDEIPRSYLFDEEGLQQPEGRVVVMVGPEGDFSLEEVKFAVQHGFLSVSLGKSRLRTETAGLMAVTMVQLRRQL